MLGGIRRLSNVISTTKRFHSGKSVNILLCTDVYKMGHLEQYKPGIQKTYSYLQARSDKNLKETVFFGLQYYLKEYLTRPITHKDVDEFVEARNAILGSTSPLVEKKMRTLADLGYWPVEIKAVPEGTVMPVKNVLMTITNTKPEFYWAPGYLESMLLKLWHPITVSTISLQYKRLVDKYFKETVSENLQGLKSFMVHDFGYRSDSSEESAAISAISFLGTGFVGSDSLVAFPMGINYYGVKPGANDYLKSVPASEHSVMCSFGKGNELEAFKNMLKLYPTGIVSIVSDTYDVFNVLTNFTSVLKPDILSRDGKVVFRPDSGNPEFIICGNPNVDPTTPEGKGCLRLLDEAFGSSINEKGYKELNPKVGLIYGDGMYLGRYEKTLERMKDMGYAASNLVIGIGGVLRHPGHGRDHLGFAIKATSVIINGKQEAIYKDPITDPGKKSHTGLLRLEKTENGYITLDNVTNEQEKGGLLVPVFRDGKLLVDEDIYTIRKRVESTNL